MRGYNFWCLDQETPHFEETSPIWDYSEALRLESSRRGSRLALLEGFCFSMPRPFMLAGSGWQQGTERSGEEAPTQQGGRGGLITPLGGIRRGTDPQEPGVGRQQRLLGTQVDERVRA